MLQRSAAVTRCSFPPSSSSWSCRAQRAGKCAHEAQRTGASATAGVERILILAHAGSLDVTGRTGVTNATARGRACASDADDLAELNIRVRREGSTLVIEATDPDDDINWRNGHYAYLDLTVDVPHGMAVEIEDGSGDMTVAGVGAARLHDGSGNLRANDVRGALYINDGSGDIEVARVAGSVEIEDGSGEIDLVDVRGSVVIEDGSGDVRTRDVGGSVRIEDGSGEIRITQVVENVVIDDDGSGSIRVEGVGGDFTVDDDGSGDVSYDDVRGRVSVPDDD